MDKTGGDKLPRLTSPTVTLPEVTFRVLDDYVAPAGTVPQSVDYYRYVEKTAEEIDSHIEYDMDEEVVTRVYCILFDSVETLYFNVYKEYSDLLQRRCSMLQEAAGMKYSAEVQCYVLCSPQVLHSTVFRHCIQSSSCQLLYICFFKKTNELH